MAVHMMAQDGLIDLDADIHRYLPELAAYDSEVTIRTMLGHVSGLPDYEDSLVTGTGDPLRDYADARIFGPLGMTHSLFSDNGTDIIKNRATGYKPNGKGGFMTNMTNAFWVGDGGVHTSLNDFLYWERNFTHPQLGQDPAQLIAAINTPNSDIRNSLAKR